MKEKVFLLFGRSGCGKGTQAELLGEKYNLPVYGSGEMLRSRMEKNDFSAKKLKEVVGRGQLAPTFFIFKMWANKFEDLKESKGFEGMIIDGSPRTLIEAKLLDEALAWYEWDVFRLLIDISRQEAENRLLRRRICRQCGNLIPFVGEFKNLEKCDRCGGELIHRSDDEETAIKERLDYYDREVEPAVKYFEEQGKLITINGEQPIADVFKEIEQKL